MDTQRKSLFTTSIWDKSGASLPKREFRRGEPPCVDRVTEAGAAAAALTLRVET